MTRRFALLVVALALLVSGCGFFDVTPPKDEPEPSRTPSAFASPTGPAVVPTDYPTDFPTPTAFVTSVPPSCPYTEQRAVQLLGGRWTALGTEETGCTYFGSELNFSGIVTVNKTMADDKDCDGAKRGVKGAPKTTYICQVFESLRGVAVLGKRYVIVTIAVLDKKKIPSYLKTLATLLFYADPALSPPSASPTSAPATPAPS